MAHSRLLLLLIGLICSHLPEVQGRPIDFWCNNKARTNMRMAVTLKLKKKMDDCVGSETLPSPVQLPCVGINTAEWANKTVQQKSAEVMGALRVFRDGVQSVRNQITCQTSLLGTLEHHITNYITIVNFVYEQNGTPQAAVEHCYSVTNLNEVVEKFGKLLIGKLTFLARDLSNSICKSDHTKTNSNGS